MLALIAASFCCWAVPIVSNVHMEQIEGTKDIRITYDLADNFNTQLWVSVSVQLLTNVTTWSSSYLPVFSVEGDIRRWVEPGLGKEIIWHAGTDWNGRYTDMAKAYVDAISKIKDTYHICSDGNLRFTTSGGSLWFANGDNACCAGAHSNACTLKTTVHGSGTISFQWWVSKGSYQTLQLLVDGETKLTKTNTSQTSHSYAITSSGPHTIEWVYTKTTSSSGYNAFVANVKWE